MQPIRVTKRLNMFGFPPVKTWPTVAAAGAMMFRPVGRVNRAMRWFGAVRRLSRMGRAGKLPVSPASPPMHDTNLTIDRPPLTLDALREKVNAGDVDTVVMVFPDTNGRLVG